MGEMKLNLRDIILLERCYTPCGLSDLHSNISMEFALPVNGGCSVCNRQSRLPPGGKCSIEQLMTPPRLQSATDKAFTTPPERPGNATVGYDPQSRFKNGFQAWFIPYRECRLTLESVVSRNQVAISARREEREREQYASCSLKRGIFPSLLGKRTLAISRHHYCSLMDRAPDRPKRSCC